MTTKFETPKEYFVTFDGETLKRLMQLRDCIYQLEPDAEEKISYNIPAYFKNKKMFCYISGYAHHVSLYPGRIPDETFQKKFAEYLSGKSTLKFPHDKPLPMDAVREFVTWRLKEIEDK